MTDTNDQIVQKIRKAKTDSNPLPANIADLKARPEAFNLVSIFAALQDTKIDEVLDKFKGQGFSTFKQALIDITVDHLNPISNEIKRWTQEPEEIDSVLADGAERASTIARPIIQEVHQLMGFLGAGRRS